MRHFAVFSARIRHALRTSLDLGYPQLPPSKVLISYESWPWLKSPLWLSHRHQPHSPDLPRTTVPRDTRHAPPRIQGVKYHLAGSIHWPGRYDQHMGYWIRTVLHLGTLFTRKSAHAVASNVGLVNVGGRGTTRTLFAEAPNLFERQVTKKHYLHLTRLSLTRMANFLRAGYYVETRYTDSPKKMQRFSHLTEWDQQVDQTPRSSYDFTHDVGLCGATCIDSGPNHGHAHRAEI